MYKERMDARAHPCLGVILTLALLLTCLAPSPDDENIVRGGAFRGSIYSVKVEGLTVEDAGAY